MGPALANALGDASSSVALVAGVLLWIGWGVGLVAVLVPRTVGLTALRIGAPGALAVALWAGVAGGDVGPAEIVAIAWSAATAALVLLLPAVADGFVDGSAYGSERRFNLRVPASVLVGPAEIAWVAVAVGLVAGPMLLAAERWVAGAVAVVLGVPLVWLGVRALHQLARRWVVFVPAGIVLHDPLALGEPLLFPTRTVRRLGPAPVDGERSATDLSGRALGLVLELELTGPVDIEPTRTGEDGGGKVRADRLLFTPARPGAVLAEATTRGLPVG